MDRFFYWLIYSFCRIHAILPFRVLYVFADINYILVYHLFRYRKKMVRKNLRNSFPEKTEKELLRIEKDYYHHLCDYFFETIKLLHISDDAMRRRMKFINIEQIQQILQDGNSCFLLLGHYGNWEWVTSITLWVSPENRAIGQIYRPLKNQAFDRFFLKMRARFHSVGIAKNDTLRAIVRLRREGKQLLIGFMSDQKPSQNNMHYWTTFLNQETSILTGAERIASQTGFAVCYLDVRKVKRGYYEGEVKLICPDAKVTEPFEITEKYARMMEKTIQRDPAYWLWSHNRWKHKREVESEIAVENE